jgi:hypothetical protein
MRIRRKTGGGDTSLRAHFAIRRALRRRRHGRVPRKGSITLVGTGPPASAGAGDRAADAARCANRSRSGTGRPPRRPGARRRCRRRPRRSGARALPRSSRDPGQRRRPQSVTAPMTGVALRRAAALEEVPVRDAGRCALGEAVSDCGRGCPQAGYDGDTAYPPFQERRPTPTRGVSPSMCRWGAGRARRASGLSPRVPSPRRPSVRPAGGAAALDEEPAGAEAIDGRSSSSPDPAQQVADADARLAI